MMGAGISRGRRLVALGLRMRQNILVHVLRGARCRGTTGFQTPHYLLVKLC